MNFSKLRSNIAIKCILTLWSAFICFIRAKTEEKLFSYTLSYNVYNDWYVTVFISNIFCKYIIPHLTISFEKKKLR